MKSSISLNSHRLGFCALSFLLCVCGCFGFRAVGYHPSLVVAKPELPLPTLTIKPEDDQRQPLVQFKSEPMPWTHNTKVYGEFDQEDISFAWASVGPDATSKYLCEDVEGEVPKDIAGTFYKNGPANFARGGQSFGHMLDGDGFVSSFLFEDGSVCFSGRFVETKDFLEEQKKDKVLFRGVFGTQRKGGILSNALDLKLKNPANTNVLAWGQRLLALWELGAPVELDPTTMKALCADSASSLPLFDKLGPSDCLLRGVTVDKGGPIDRFLKCGHCFTAHPHALDENTLVGFSSAIGGNTVSMHFLEYDKTWNLKRQVVEYDFAGLGPPHDFSISRDRYAFFQNQLDMDKLEYVFGLKSPIECMRLLLDEPALLHIVPRDASSDPEGLQVKVPNYFCSHNVGEAQQEGNHLILYSTGWQLTDERFFPKSDKLSSMELFPWGGEPDFKGGKVPPPNFFRTVVDISTGELVSHEEVVPGLVAEMPNTAMKSEQGSHKEGVDFVYAGASGTSGATDASLPLVGLCKINLSDDSADYWWAGHRTFTGEPMPVAKRNGEDGHWILTLLHDAKEKRTSLAILDSERFQDGPVALVKLQTKVPIGLHSFFSPSSAS